MRGDQAGCLGESDAQLLLCPRGFAQLRKRHAEQMVHRRLQIDEGERIDSSVRRLRVTPGTMMDLCLQGEGTPVITIDAADAAGELECLIRHAELGVTLGKEHGRWPAQRSPRRKTIEQGPHCRRAWGALAQAATNSASASARS